MTDPPAIYWMPDGPQAGFYIYAPGLGGRWRRTLSDHHGVHDWTVDELPVGARALYDYDTVAEAIDQYRDTLLQTQEAIREDGDRHDPHEQARAEVLTELVDSEGYAIMRADERAALARGKAVQ